jgi:hypothetical protein
MNIESSHPVLPEVWDRPFVKAHRKWCNDFVIELRLQDQSGPVIGERLAEIEGHCTETGESPEEGFGSARDYARQVADLGEPEPDSGVWRITLLCAAQALALLVGSAALNSWARDEPVTYNVIQALCLVLFLAVLLALPKFLPSIVRHPMVFGALLIAAVLTAVGSAVAGRLGLPVLLGLPAPAVSSALFLVVLVLSYLQHRELAGTVDDGRVTSPLPSSVPLETSPSRASHWTVLVPVIAVPVSYCLLAAFAFAFA